MTSLFFFLHDDVTGFFSYPLSAFDKASLRNDYGLLHLKEDFVLSRYFSLKTSPFYKWKLMPPFYKNESAYQDMVAFYFFWNCLPEFKWYGHFSAFLEVEEKSIFQEKTFMGKIKG